MSAKPPSGATIDKNIMRFQQFFFFATDSAPLNILFLIWRFHDSLSFKLLKKMQTDDWLADNRGICIYIITIL